MPKEPERVTFVDMPGSMATDDMLAPYRQRLAAEGTALPAEDEDDELPLDDEDPIEKRLATLEAENQRLRNQETVQATASRQQQINSILNDLTEAARYGDDECVKQLRAYLDQLAGTTAALPTAAPGHWSNDVANLVQRWKSERTWLGRDVARMQAMQQVGGALDPARYATAAEYFKAVEEQIEVAVAGRSGRDTDGAGAPRPRNGAAGGPSLASANNAGGARGGARKLTSIAQLSPREREVAQTMMRIGKLTEAQYIDSYNSVRASAEAHRRAVARTALR